MSVAAAVLAGSALSGGANLISNIATNAYNVAAQKKINRENIAAQKEINEAQLKYAKNAYSYAAADRMRSGLSPLDTQATSLNGLQAQSLQAPQAQAPQFPDFGSAAASAIGMVQQQKQIDSVSDLNSALRSKAEAEANGKDIENVKQLSTLRTQIDTQFEELKKLRNENSAFASRLAKDLQLSQARYDDLLSQINQRNRLTPSIEGLNNSRSVAAQEEARLTGAKADYEESQNKTSTNLNIPRSILDSVQAGNAQAMLIYNALVSSSNKRVSDYDSGDIEAAYRSYIDSYKQAKSELDAEIKQWNSNPNHSRVEREALQSRLKELGSKPLSRKEFASRIK